MTGKRKSRSRYVLLETTRLFLLLTLWLIVGTSPDLLFFVTSASTHSVLPILAPRLLSQSSVAFFISHQTGNAKRYSTRSRALKRLPLIMIAN